MSKNVYASNGNASDEVTTEENTPGVFTPILVVEPKDGQAMEIDNTGPLGSAKRGVPIFMDLKQGAGTDMPADTEVVLGYKEPGDDQYRHISDKFASINDYLNLNISEQQHKDRIDAFKHALTDPQGWRVLDIDELALLVKSSAKIDHANSTVQVEPSYVRTVDISR